MIKSLRWKFIAKGDFLHGVSAIPVKSFFYRKIGKNIVKKFQLSRIFERFVKEREKKGPILRIIQQGEQNSRSPNALCSTCSSECVQSLVKLTWNLLAKGMELAQEHV